MIKRVVALIAAIVGALLVSLAPAVAIPDTPAAATPTFDFVHHSTPTASVVTERGPPGAHDPPAAYDYDAGDRWSPGAFVRSERAASSVAYTYDDNARLAQVARGVPSTERRVQATRAISGAFSRGGVAANGGRTLARTCLRSFVGTTLVLMADGSKKPIEDIEVGDRVVATDPETGERVTRKVTRVWVHEDQVLDLMVDGEVITTTEDHLFWSVTDQRFERAERLGAGEILLGDGGRRITVSGLQLGTAREALAYNLSIAGVHTYHVGDYGIVVHNDCDPFDAARALRGADPEDVLDAIPDNWIVSDAPKAVGGGIKFSNPANRSQIIIFERGTGLASDGVHGGPYLRLSSGRGGIERIPLLGNPYLAVP